MGKWSLGEAAGGWTEMPDGGKAPMGSGRTVRPYFFLSYARTPRRDPADKADPDRWVYKLYKDLCDAILQLTDVEPEEAGYMDRENKVGSEWSPELLRALRTCRVFVPLYSRRYFESDYCGKEWFAFARRQFMNRARRPEVDCAIVPALWTRMELGELPQVAKAVQFEHSVLGARYCAEGFYGIMKLKNCRADYLQAVHRLAERIVDIGDASPVADDRVVPRQRRPDFNSLPSAFGPESATRTANGQLRIAVLAHDIYSLPRGRGRDYYGPTPHSWSPYRPDYPEPVVDYAADLATECLNCTPLVEPAGGGMPGHGGNGQMPPTLYLVDAWVSQSEVHREQLARLNEAEEPWVSVLVPWNSSDEQTSAAAPGLHENLQAHLGRKLAGIPRRCAMAANGIPTLEDFGQVLPEMTMTILKRYRKAASADPAAGPAGRRNRLRVIESEDSGDSHE
jgi:FxsC-like protein